MTAAIANSQRSTARLRLSDRKELSITSDETLRAALNDLQLVADGETATLTRDPKNYIRATRRGVFWSAETRRGGWWTLASFTAEMTSDFSARQVQESRAAGSLRKRLAMMLASPRAEHLLSTDQVRTVFTEYYAGKPFTIPQSGA